MAPDLVGLMLDDTHLMDIACQIDTNLPDTVSAQRGLSEHTYCPYHRQRREGRAG